MKISRSETREIQKSDTQSLSVVWDFVPIQKVYISKRDGQTEERKDTAVYKRLLALKTLVIMLHVMFFFAIKILA